MAGKYTDFVGSAYNGGKRLATGAILLATTFLPQAAFADENGEELIKKLFDNGYKVSSVSVLGGENLKDGKYLGELHIRVADVDDLEIVRFFAEKLKEGATTDEEKEVDTGKPDPIVVPKAGEKTPTIKEKVKFRKYKLPDSKAPETTNKEKYTIVVKGFEDKDSLMALRAKVETDGFLMLSGDQRLKLLDAGIKDANKVPFAIRDEATKTYVVLPDVVISIREPQEYENMVSRLLREVSKNRGPDAQNLMDKFGARNKDIGLPANVVGSEKERYKTLVEALEKFRDKQDGMLNSKVRKIAEDHGVKFPKKPQKTVPAGKK